ncbi:MAG: type II toxin-antitoxin system VapC family toxin [Desulfobacteraceae bacterium]|nr:type II toxin-antitoxin system VapC family toxin [Desulfobacteraceae bacterium]
METAYFDTSALIKRYVAETGSRWVNALLASSRPTVFISQLTVIESVCGFSRRLREGAFSGDDYNRLLAAFDYDTVSRYVIADIMPVTIDTACQMAGRHPLRAYDAVHLATAWLINRELIRNGRYPLTFVCSDNRLLAVCRNEGLLTENPNNY